MTTAILKQPTQPTTARKPNRSFIHGLISNKKALVGMIVMLVFIALALLAPALFPGDPSRITAMASLEPSPEHWLGTTAKGQDVLALTVHGSRSSLFVGLTVGFASTFIGILVGLASAYFGKFIDEALSLVTNVFLLLPGLPLLVILAAFLPPGLGTVILVLTVTGWAGSARVLRSQALSIRSKDFVAAAVVSGERAGRIMFRETCPTWPRSSWAPCWPASSTASAPKRAWSSWAWVMSARSPGATTSSGPATRAPY